jgi:fructose-1,6-bisphosphatase/inositol monophosphatase family enzyme
MNQYLDAAIKVARAAGALVRENFGRPLKVNVEEAHDIKLELDVRSQALITDYPKVPARQSIILKAEFDNLRASQI